MKLRYLLLAASVAACSADDETTPTCESQPGVACIWAGHGPPGFDGDGKELRASRLYNPIDLSFAPDGTPWVLDWNNHKIRRVVNGRFETVVGDFLGDGDPDMLDLTAEGAPGLTVRLNHPTDLQFRSDGTLVVAAWHNHKLREVNPRTGIVHVACGLGPGFAGDGKQVGDARFNQPKSIELADDGTLYILDQRNQRLRRIGADGAVSTIAGTGTQGFNGDDKPLIETQFNFETGGNPQPSGALALDGQGRLYVADSLNHRIRRIDLAAGTITTIAGTGEAGGTGDGGPATAAQLHNPRDLEFGPDGKLYVADTENHVVRAIDLTSGVIERVAGTGTAGRGDEGKPAREVALTRPFGIAFDADGALYVADSFNDRILRIPR